MAGVTTGQGGVQNTGRTPQAIVALDYPSTESALALVARLGSSCRFYKVGSQLFTAAGPAAVEAIRNEGCDVFLDLKLHDIPNTVAGAVRSIRDMDVRLTTVHASGGRTMLEAAVKAAGPSCGVLAVTVLTSLDAAGLAEIAGTGEASVADTALRLAALASSAGARGVVCSGEEAKLIRGRFGPTLELLVPGIRLPGDEPGDQSRIVTPEAAVAAGADYLVVGRSVTGASDPRVAMQSILERILTAD
jgi:orotidine-5'-phosphate decarboxylase